MICGTACELLLRGEEEELPGLRDSSRKTETQEKPLIGPKCKRIAVVVAILALVAVRPGMRATMIK